MQQELRNGKEKSREKSSKENSEESGPRTASKPKIRKQVYFFGGGKADGNARMKDLLGGKGANLAEMASLVFRFRRDLRLPPRSARTTMPTKEVPAGLDKEVAVALAKVEKIMNRKLGDAKAPLLVSVRSGARSSMPGMMETVLNVGLTSKTIPGMIEQSGSERFVYDAYRRLITMYSDVVMEKSRGHRAERRSGHSPSA